MDQMLDAGRAGGVEPPHAGVLDQATCPDRSMQVLEYLVALIAIVAALALTTIR